MGHVTKVLKTRCWEIKIDLCGAVVGISLINASVLWEFFNLSDNAVFQF